MKMTRTAAYTIELSETEALGLLRELGASNDDGPAVDAFYEVLVEVVPHDRPDGPSSGRRPWPTSITRPESKEATS